MRKLLFLFAFGLLTSAAYAQTAPKIGYANVDYILGQMPEFKQVDTDLRSLENQLKKNLEAKGAEFQRKVAEYQQNLNTMLEAVRANTERELTQLQQNLQKMQEEAQAEIQKKSTTLMDPVYAKVGKTIEDVAKENGFTLILNSQISGLDVVLYGDSSVDVSDLVLKKMGVTPAAPSAPKN